MSLSPPFRDFLTVRSEEGDDPSAHTFGGRLSPAKLNLQRVYEQNLRGAQKKDVSKLVDPSAPAGVPTKGKPRLLLMGQRRYVAPSLLLEIVKILTREIQKRKVLHLKCSLPQATAERDLVLRVNSQNSEGLHGVRQT